MVQGKGLFPTPEEIKLECSCPDWATMCKHVAATLYGVGARLDEDPALFFTLRQAAIDDLVSDAVQSKTAAIIEKKPRDSSRHIADDKLADLFGLDMDEPDFAKPVKPAKPVKKLKTKRERGKAPAVEKLKKTRKPKKSKKAETKTKTKTDKNESLQGHPTAIAFVAHCINGAKGNLTVKDLEELTGLQAKKLYGILFRLKQQGKVKNPAHGYYCHV